MGTHIYEFHIRVLIYREDGEIVAHALEMDLLGYGKSEEEAVRELQANIESQLTFARQQGDDSLLDFPAPKEYFERWETAHQAALKNRIFPDKPITLSAKAVVISIDQTLRQARRPDSRHRFQPLNPSCA